MSNEAETEIMRRVHYDGATIEVGDWPEGPDYIELRAVGEENVAYWGNIRMAMHPNMALHLGQALVDAAKEKGAK